MYIFRGALRIKHNRILCIKISLQSDAHHGVYFTYTLVTAAAAVVVASLNITFEISI